MNYRLCALLAIVSLAGCQAKRPLGEVSGTVTLGGAPLAGALVAFVPDPAQHAEAPRSTGTTDQQGKYRLQCDDGRPGAVIGAHTVTVVDLALNAPVVTKGSEEENVTPAGAAARKPRVPAMYQSPNTSPLRKDVAAGEQTIDLELADR